MLDKIDRFEDLVAWQKARDLTRAIYQITQDGAFTREFGLARPIQRAAVSIMSNIAEGFERAVVDGISSVPLHSKGFLCGGPLSTLCGIRHRLSQKSEFQRLLAQAEELGRVLGGLRASVEKLGMNGELIMAQHSALSTQHSILAPFPVIEPELVPIPAGDFLMGSDLAQANEQPVHRVR